MAKLDRSNAMDHVVLVIFENRSFDNLLGHLYGPKDGKTWKVYIKEASPLSFTGFVHWAKIKGSFATHFVPFEQFKQDAANGTLPDFSLIEPNLFLGHGDYHPAASMSQIWPALAPQGKEMDELKTWITEDLKAATKPVPSGD